MFDNEEEIMRKFGANVKKYRNRLKLTQEMLAEKCECSPQTISGTETGYSFPSSKILFKLARALNVPIMYLFNFGEDTLYLVVKRICYLKIAFQNCLLSKKELH